MIFETVGLILAILSCSYLEAYSVDDHHPEEEFVIDHEISYKNAIEEAKKLQIYPGPIAGCKSCIPEEISYCSDERVINDHCCCDNAPENDVFRFVPHVCLIGPEACKVYAGDCFAYTRLRECCCHAYRAEKWKNIANGSTNLNYYFYSCTIALAAFVKLFLSWNW